MVERPNILLIITDSQGPNLLGEAGLGHIKTPCIDRLAREGTCFTRAYNTTPVCTPARCGLFTGLYPHTGGAWSNDLPLGSQVNHMGSYFQALGYETAYIGKWHLDGTDYFGTGHCPDGWNPEYWYDGKNYLNDLSVEERLLWRKGLNSPQSIKERNITRENTWAGQITERARRFMRNHAIDNGGKPFILVISYDEPHAPSVCPPPFCDMYKEFVYPTSENYRASLIDKPASHRAWAETFSIPLEGIRNPLYFGAASFVDDEIGKVVDQFDSMTPKEEGLTLFTSDHGHYLGAHGLETKGPAHYEEVVNVPLIIRGACWKPGYRDDRIISHLDILPTLYDLLEEPVNPLWEGVSFLSNPPREAAFVEFNRFGNSHDGWFGMMPIRTVVTSEWKLTINLDYTDELYHLYDDPHEMTNLIDLPEYKEKAVELHSMIISEMNRTRDPFRSPRWYDRPWSSLTVPSCMEGERRCRVGAYNYDTGMPA